MYTIFATLDSILLMWWLTTKISETIEVDVNKPYKHSGDSLIPALCVMMTWLISLLEFSCHDMGNQINATSAAKCLDRCYPATVLIPSLK